MSRSLDLDEDQLNTCVGCGLCLPYCPTFRVTGHEALSPRGRIDAMRGVVDRDLAIDETFVGFMSTCVQCRGCEPACPSGVPYGSLISATRSDLAERRDISPRWLRTGFAVLAHHRLLLIGSTALAAAQRLRLVPERFVSGRLPLRRGQPVRSTAASDPDAWLFTGCVMDAWMRPVHRATAAVLDALGVGYAIPGDGGGCCGALHEHAGLTADARALAHRVMRSMPGDAPILVNSAGCGAQLKDYGHLVGTEAADRFASRVVDIHEWVEPRADELQLTSLDRTVIVQDPCHLRHVQRVEGPMHDLLRRVVTLVELDDDGLCCGAGGAYSIVEPQLADRIRERKIDSIDRALQNHPQATVLASANPGCAMFLEAELARRDVTTTHPIELIAQALR